MKISFRAPSKAFGVSLNEYSLSYLLFYSKFCIFIRKGDPKHCISFRPHKAGSAPCYSPQYNPTSSVTHICAENRISISSSKLGTICEIAFTFSDEADLDLLWRRSFREMMQQLAHCTNDISQFRVHAHASRRERILVAIIWKCLLSGIWLATCQRNLNFCSSRCHPRMASCLLVSSA
jgi:hypothetical protein